MVFLLTVEGLEALQTASMSTSGESQRSQFPLDFARMMPAQDFEACMHDAMREIAVPDQGYQAHDHPAVSGKRP